MRALTPVARAVRLVGRSRKLTWAQAAWAAYITAEQGLEIALVVFAYGHGGIAAAGLLAAPRSGAPPGAAPFTAGPRGPLRPPPGGGRGGPPPTRGGGGGSASPG